jgi:hypothetical protein
MKFSNMFSFISNRTLSIILLILCILVALAFSNMTLFKQTPNIEGMLSLGDAKAISLLIKEKEDAIQKKILASNNQPKISNVFASQSSTSNKFAKLRADLATDPETLTAINLIINDGYSEIYKSLMTNYGTNVDVIPSLTQGCNGDEACVTNTKTMADSVLANASGGGGSGGGLGL